MTAQIRMDAHKLLVHPAAVAAWLRGGEAWPISAEVSLSNRCNHRCTFCALDYTGYRNVLMDAGRLHSALGQMRSHGLKSVVYSGEGEPFTHPEAAEVIGRTAGLGLDMGLSSNGILWDAERGAATLPHLTWIRFSLAAASPRLYAKIHRAPPGDLEKALNNIAAGVELKKRKNLGATLGAQLLLIPENIGEVLPLGRLLKDIGVDYYTVKPYSHNPQSLNRLDPAFDYDQLLDVEADLKALAAPEFQIYFRASAMRGLKEGRHYDQCRAWNFFVHIATTGAVTPCIAFIDDPAYSFGNINEDDFETLWKGRSGAAARIAAAGTGPCREICRSHEMNKYLHELAHPGGHVNFL